MPGIVILKLEKTRAFLATQTEAKTVDAQNHCAFCQISFALAEKRVRHEGQDHHEDCAKKARRDRIKELFIRRAAEQGLSVVPRHHIHRN